MFTIDSFVLFVFFHNTPFTVFLRAEVIFLPQFFLNCGIFFYVLHNLIKNRRHAFDTKPFRRRGISIPQKNDRIKTLVILSPSFILQSSVALSLMVDMRVWVISRAEMTAPAKLPSHIMPSSPR